MNTNWFQLLKKNLWILVIEQQQQQNPRLIRILGPAGSRQLKKNVTKSLSLSSFLSSSFLGNGFVLKLSPWDGKPSPSNSRLISYPDAALKESDSFFPEHLTKSSASPHDS